MLEICAGAVVLACAIAIALMLRLSKPFSVVKRASGAEMHVTVKANADLARVELNAGDGIGFVRKGVRSGQSVEFVYPASQQHATLAIEPAKGKAASFQL